MQTGLAYSDNSVYMYKLRKRAVPLLGMQVTNRHKSKNGYNKANWQINTNHEAKGRVKTQVMVK